MLRHLINLIQMTLYNGIDFKHDGTKDIRRITCISITIMLYRAYVILKINRSHYKTMHFNSRYFNYNNVSSPSFPANLMVLGSRKILTLTAQGPTLDVRI